MFKFNSKCIFVLDGEKRKKKKGDKAKALT